MQNTPHQMQITFRTLHSKSQKKILSVCKFFNVSLWIHTAFDETIPKRYNTWGLVISNLPRATPTHPSHTHHPAKVWNMTPDPKCYTFLESSHQMQTESEWKNSKNCNLKEFFFWDLLCKVRKVIRIWWGVFCMIWKKSFCKSCLSMSEVPESWPSPS